MTRGPSALAALLVLAPLATGCLSFHQGAIPGEPARARFAEIDGARIRYSDTGGDGSPAPRMGGADEGAARPEAPRDEPTVVLVHGFASSLNVWDAVVPELAKTHRVIALDLKGFGWSDRPSGDYSPEAEARIVLDLLEQRGVARAAFVGHSWGSSVVLAAALAAPERVSRVALYDAWVYEEQLPPFFHWSRAGGVGEVLFGLFYKERADERMALAFFDQRYVTEELVEAVEGQLERPGTAAAALAAVRGQRYAGLESRYASIDKPALLLWGREDLVTPLRFGERLATELGNARLVTYPRCGHFPMIEARAASTRELTAFLASDR